MARTRKRVWVEVKTDTYSDKDPLRVKYQRKMLGLSSGMLGTFLLFVFFYQDYMMEQFEDILPIMMAPWVYITTLVIFFLITFIQFVRLAMLDINSRSEVTQYYSRLSSMRFNVFCFVISLPLLIFIGLDTCRVLYITLQSY